MLRKNNGHVLLIVLFILTIAFILITGLFSLSINTRSQLNHSEIDMQKTNAAEMGISLFEKNILKVIQTDNYKTLKDLLQQLNDHLIALQGERTLDSNLSYKISKVDVSSSLDDSKENTIITVNITSQGIFKNSIKTLDKTYTLTVPNKNGNGGNSGGGIFTDKNQFLALNNNSFPTLSPALNGSLTPIHEIKNCQFKGDVSFNYKDVTFSTCDYSIDGNARFDYLSFSFLTKFSISNDALFNGIFYFGYQSELNIGGNALFNGRINQNLILQYYRQALTVNGNSRFNDSVQLNYSKNSLLGNSYFHDSLELYGANLSIGKNVFFNHQVSLNRDPFHFTPSTMTIEGSAYFNDNLSVSNNSSIYINGNLYTNQHLDVFGTVCVNGNSDLEAEGSNTNAKIIRNADSCGNSPGTIYILNKPVQTDDTINSSDIHIDSSNVQYH